MEKTDPSNESPNESLQQTLDPATRLAIAKQVNQSDSIEMSVKGKHLPSKSKTQIDMGDRQFNTHTV